MPVISVDNLSRTYTFYKKDPGVVGSLSALINRKTEEARAVDTISFSIEEGELVGFLGPNGAGKTTTLKMLSGLIHPTSGRLSVLGYEPRRREKVFQKQFALVMGQKSQLWEDLPAYEGFVLNQAIYELDDATFRANLDELVATLDVRDILHVQTRKLSLGQRMKCELIAALLHNPRVLFLDEPTIGLDVVAQQNMREFIKKYNRQQKTTILLTSHYMEDIKELCERIIIINLGRIIYDGPLKALINKYATHKVLTITFNQGGASHGELARYGEVDYQSPFHSIVSVPRSEATAVASALLSSGLPVDDILIDEPNIDDVIRQIFQNAHARS